MALINSVASLHMSVLTGLIESPSYCELSETQRLPSPDVDRGWAWMVVFFSWIGHLLVYGPSWSSGILYIEFLEEFQELPSVTAWIGTISAACTLFGGPLSSLFIGWFGNRWTVVIGTLTASAGLFLSAWATSVYFLYITFGIIAGLGWSVAYLPLINVLGEYFSKYRKISVGLATSGAGLGLFIFPPLLSLLHSVFFWRGTMLILAGVNLNLLLAAVAFMPPRRPEAGEQERRELLAEKLRRQRLQQSKTTASVLSLSEKTPKPWYKACHLARVLELSLFKNPHYVALLFNNLLYSFAVSIVFTHISNYAKTLHYHSFQCSILVSVIGVTNTIGRLLLALLASLPWVNVIGIYCVCLLLLSLLTFSVLFTNSYAALVVYAFVFGFVTASFGTTTPEVIIYICGLNRLAAAYGYVLVFEAVGMLLGGPAAAWALEYLANYRSCFVMTGISAFLGGLLLVPSWIFLSRFRTIADAGSSEEDPAIPEENPAIPEENPAIPEEP